MKKGLIIVFTLLILVGCENKISTTKVIVKPQSTFIDDIPSDEWKTLQHEAINDAKKESIINLFSKYSDALEVQINRINNSGGAEGSEFSVGNQAISLHNQIVGMVNGEVEFNLDTFVTNMKEFERLLLSLGWI